MESYMFQTYQRVPRRVIKAIGEDIKANFMRRNCHLDHEDQIKLSVELDLAIAQIADEHSPSVDGYRLADKVVSVIADLIRNGKPIAAIKEFRAATGEGLRESKDFIDKFTKGRSWEEAFLMWTNTFAGV